MGIGSFFSQLFRSSKNRQENFASFRSSFDKQNLNPNGSGGYKHLIKWDKNSKLQTSLNRSNGTESDRFTAVRDAYNACGKSEAGGDETSPPETGSIDLSKATNLQLNELITACGYYLFDRSGHRWTFQGQKRKDWVSFVDRIARQQRYSNHVTACEETLGVESFSNLFSAYSILQKINESEKKLTKGASKGTAGVTTPGMTNGSKGKKSGAKPSANASPATALSQEESPEQTILEKIRYQASCASIGLNSAPWAKKYQEVANKVVEEVGKLVDGKVADNSEFKSSKFTLLAQALKSFREAANATDWTTENLDKYSKIDPTVIKADTSYDSYIHPPKNHGDGSYKGRGSGLAGMTGGGGGGGVGATSQQFKNIDQAYEYFKGK